MPHEHLYTGSDQEQTLRNKQYRDFVRAIYQYATSKEHPFPEAVAVQAGYESRYGASEVARNANNLFGIKARKDEYGNLIPNTYKARTKEEREDGTEDYLYQNFEAFKNLEENWIGYMRVINRERYIRNGVKTASTNKEYITALKRGGYATEDEYINHIMRNIEKFRKQGLFQ